MMTHALELTAPGTPPPSGLTLARRATIAPMCCLHQAYTRRIAPPALSEAAEVERGRRPHEEQRRLRAEQESASKSKQIAESGKRQADAIAQRASTNAASRAGEPNGEPTALNVSSTTRWGNLCVGYFDDADGKQQFAVCSAKANKCPRTLSDACVRLPPLETKIRIK